MAAHICQSKHAPLDSLNPSSPSITRKLACAVLILTATTSLFIHIHAKGGSQVLASRCTRPRKTRKPGVYQLVVTVTDSSLQQTAAVQARFAVE
jgi:hypothetical protein